MNVAITWQKNALSYKHRFVYSVEMFADLTDRSSSRLLWHVRSRDYPVDGRS